MACYSTDNVQSIYNTQNLLVALFMLLQTTLFRLPFPTKAAPHLIHGAVYGHGSASSLIAIILDSLATTPDA